MMDQQPMNDLETEGPVLLTFLTIAILGGTGKEGQGLAYRWAQAGYRILIGSRTPDKAVRVAEEIRERLEGTALVEGMGNLQAAEMGDIVVLSVPYKAHEATLRSVEPALEGKILVDVTVPLSPGDVATVNVPPAGSAAQEAQALLGPDVDVVAAFQNVSHELLLRDAEIQCDVLVCGGDASARAEVLKLVDAAGLVGWDAGRIENAVVVEGLSAVLIGLNKQFGVHAAGIQITGLPRPDPSPEMP